MDDARGPYRAYPCAVLAEDATGWEALQDRWVRYRGRITDVVLIAAVLVSSLTIFANGPTGADAWRRVLLSLVVAAALWWRRSHPAAVAGIAVAGVALGAIEVALLAALFSLAIRRRDRVLVALAGAGVLAFILAFVTNHVPGRGAEGVVSGFFAAAFFVGLPVGFGAFVGARRDLLASLRLRAERAEAEQHLRADQARLSERSRIAQEMHDVLAHRISLVALHAGGLEVNPDAGPESVERAAALIRTTARQALEDLRGVLGVLREDGSPDGAALAPQPTLDDVPRLVEASRQAGVNVTLEDDVPVGVPTVIGRTAYRVVQEGLTNVHKHARGASASVRLSGTPGWGLDVEVRNAPPVGGALAPLVPGAGMGLVGLTERVELAGGRLDCGPDDAGGFVVRASLPWPDVEDVE